MAIPFFSFALPLYAFWHFDDFSWGNTRRVAGMSGSEGHGSGDPDDVFDPNCIPLQEWKVIEAGGDEKQEPIISIENIKSSKKPSEKTFQAPSSRSGPSLMHPSVQFPTMMNSQPYANPYINYMYRGNPVMSEMGNPYGYSHSSYIMPGTYMNPMFAGGMHMNENVYYNPQQSYNAEVPNFHTSVQMDNTPILLAPPARHGAMNGNGSVSDKNTKSEYPSTRMDTQDNHDDDDDAPLKPVNAWPSEYPKQSLIIQTVQAILSESDLSRISRKSIREEVAKRLNIITMKPELMLFINLKIKELSSNT